MAFLDHEAYLASVPNEVRERLEQIRQEVELRVPGAIRCIGYNMPDYRQGLIFFYFGAFKRHIGTCVRPIAALLAQQRNPPSPHLVLLKL